MDSATNPRGWFAAWCVVGAALVLGVISLGPLLELPALIGAILLVTNRKARAAADGLLLGAGLVAVPVVYRLSGSRFRRISPRRDLP